MRPNEFSDVIGDGNCLHRALSVILTGKQESYKKIRQIIIDHIKENKSHFEHYFDGKMFFILNQKFKFLNIYILETNTFEKFIEGHLESKSWGDNIDLAAFYRMINVPIYVYDSKKGTWSPVHAGDDHVFFKRQKKIKNNLSFFYLTFIYNYIIYKYFIIYKFFIKPF